MLFNFVLGVVQYAQGLCWIMFLVWWIGELHVEHIVYLLCLQIDAGSFETGWWGEMECCFSQGRHFLRLGSAVAGPREAFHGLGVQDA
jgi:hypothetical protein